MSRGALLILGPVAAVAAVVLVVGTVVCAAAWGLGRILLFLTGRG